MAEGKNARAWPGLSPGSVIFLGDIIRMDPLLQGACGGGVLRLFRGLCDSD